MTEKALLLVPAKTTTTGKTSKCYHSDRGVSPLVGMEQSYYGHRWVTCKLVFYFVFGLQPAKVQRFVNFIGLHTFWSDISNDAPARDESGHNMKDRF